MEQIAQAHEPILLSKLSTPGYDQEEPGGSRRACNSGVSASQFIRE